jgi:hypothetical protein
LAFPADFDRFALVGWRFLHVLTRSLARCWETVPQAVV